jgi:hypothetical protein
LDQASQEPRISVIVEQPGDFYTILLVDTTDSFLHPILHYGATNVPGSKLFKLSLSDANPFSAYRGPSPQSYIPGIQSQHFIYEWIVSKQNAFVEEPPIVESTTQFNFRKYLEDVNATLVSSTYFSSGFCVRSILHDDALQEEETNSGSGADGGDTVNLEQKDDFGNMHITVYSSSVSLSGTSFVIVTCAVFMLLLVL